VEILIGNDSSAYAGPVAALEWRSKFLQPRWLNNNVVVHEGENIAAGFSNPCVESMGLPRFRLEQVAEALVCFRLNSSTTCRV